MLAIAALGLLASPYALAGVSPTGLGSPFDEGRVAQLEALLARLQKGDQVTDAAVDEAVQQATPNGVESFTERLRRAVLREEGAERAAAAVLLTQVTGHPERLAARLTAAPPEVHELARSIDVAFGILRADPEISAIGHRELAPLEVQLERPGDRNGDDARWPAAGRSRWSARSAAPTGSSARGCAPA